jgi:hypothetical protein
LITQSLSGNREVKSDMETHIFPLSEQEAKKLDKVTDSLHEQPWAMRTRDALRGNPEIMQWVAIGIFAGLGALCIRKALQRF